MLNQWLLTLVLVFIGLSVGTSLGILLMSALIVAKQSDTVEVGGKS
jgi:hypothetical protein